MALAEHTTAEALEGLGLAAWWLDDAAMMFEARERAYRLYRRRGDRLSAGRLATLLGIDNCQSVGTRRLATAASGARAGCWEGWRRRPSTDGSRFGRAELGASLDLVDLEMTGLGLEGLALVAQGDTAAGMTLLDEATAAAVGGEMTIPNAIGASCCYLIYACERVRDYDRAVQWREMSRAVMPR